MLRQFHEGSFSGCIFSLVSEAKLSVVLLPGRLFRRFLEKVLVSAGRIDEDSLMGDLAALTDLARLVSAVDFSTSFLTGKSLGLVAAPSESSYISFYFKQQI